ncbi:uncharacterized protein LOC112088023 [Eutrema salsugineum]|uniref:uncharacterized protein LOC112088023 n=1 Tax=Eutrema salsugineum TaxID=72664 RepID=UPI000CECF678|nr:uncharacterized protein LOC112088023 [Eutrema salsugineum]
MSGSWIWRKLLKYRDKAKEFHRREIGDGRATFFWFDIWSDLGCLYDITGYRGIIDTGIPLNATIAMAKTARRRRRHRTEHLVLIEEALSALSEEKDISLWRNTTSEFKPYFSSKNTWTQIRDARPLVQWHKGIWFKFATPKYAFCSWLAIRNRLSTGDRMIAWNPGISSECIFCSATNETRDHLFFSCPFSATIWTRLASGLLATRFTTDWHTLTQLISDDGLAPIPMFLTRYVLQCAIYSIWRERNSRRHGKTPNAASRIIQQLDKQVRNRLSTIRSSGFTKLEGSLQFWFATR